MDETTFATLWVREDSVPRDPRISMEEVISRHVILEDIGIEPNLCDIFDLLVRKETP
jgi:hypothetical protein